VGRAARRIRRATHGDGISPAIWEKETVKQAGAAALAAYPFWLITSRSMQYAWGSNVGIQLMDEVAGTPIAAATGVVINSQNGGRVGIKRRPARRCISYVGMTKGPAVLSQGIRPDTLADDGPVPTTGPRPYAKDMKAPSMNSLIRCRCRSPIATAPRAAWLANP